MRPRHHRGFTLIEMAVTLGIIAVLAALAYASLKLLSSRASLSTTGSDLAALLYNARQNSLATGRNTVVMVFPDQASRKGGTGRVVVYVDGAFNFMSTLSTVSPRFDTWDASLDAGVFSTNLLGAVDLPTGVSFGFGLDTAPALAAPYSFTPTSCNFCKTGSDHRGAIVFDSRGRANFYSGGGAAITGLTAGTLAIGNGDLARGYRLFVISPSTGAVRPYAP